MLTISGLTEYTELPITLLQTADPDLQKIKSYCQINKVFVAKLKEEIIAVYVLKVVKFRAEILNIAVAELHQNKGIGKQLIQHAIEFCKKEKIKILEVGTGNSSISQIAFYQKCGFRMVGVIKDYFIEKYAAPIFENGIQRRDMVRFEMKLKIG